jgi:hypothetical protein
LGMAGLLLWALWARVEPSGSSPRSSSALLALTLEDCDWSGGLGLCQFVGHCRDGFCCTSVY